jgi:hypothetical protein
MVNPKRSNAGCVDAEFGMVFIFEDETINVRCDSGLVLDVTSPQRVSFFSFFSVIRSNLLDSQNEEFVSRHLYLCL